jgi:SGNH domain (fused to AT3 domains)
MRAALLVALAASTGTLAPPAAAAGPADSDGDQLSDAFETHYGITDPGKDDTDGDGVRDAAEDPDHDGLSNLGEQRFGTDPTDADTDGDGTRDGAEDANANGISNAWEQDRRPVPSHLVPSLDAALADKPINVLDGCNTRMYVSRVEPCHYGAQGGSTTIVIYGDSHASQWLPAVLEGAKARGWDIVVLTKTACPATRVRVRVRDYPGTYRSCRRWRDTSSAWISAHPPDLVFISDSRRYAVLTANGGTARDGVRERLWGRGLSRTLARLPAAARALVLADTPRNAYDVPVCLAAHLGRISTCQTARSHMIYKLHDSAERAAAEEHGARFASLNRSICPYDPCPLIVNDLLIWRDQDHITATYSRQLAPSLAALVSQSLVSKVHP